MNSNVHMALLSSNHQNQLIPYMTPHIMESGGIANVTVGCQPITIPKDEPIKKVYVELVRQVIESEVKNNEDDE